MPQPSGNELVSLTANEGELGTPEDGVHIKVGNVQLGLELFGVNIFVYEAPYALRWVSLNLRLSCHGRDVWSNKRPSHFRRPRVFKLPTRFSIWWLRKLRRMRFVEHVARAKRGLVRCRPRQWWSRSGYLTSTSAPQLSCTAPTTTINRVPLIQRGGSRHSHSRKPSLASLFLADIFTPESPEPGRPIPCYPSRADSGPSARHWMHMRRHLPCSPLAQIELL